MPRLPTVHEAFDPRSPRRTATLEASRHSRQPSSAASGMPRVLMLIMVGITVGAALTVATMAMTDGPAEDQSARDQLPYSRKAVPRSTAQVLEGVSTSRSGQRQRTSLLESSNTATSIPSSNKLTHISTWKSSRGSFIPQMNEQRHYQGSNAPPLQQQDFVHAIVTGQAHEYLALDSRQWRKSRTYFATNYTVPPEMQVEAARFNEVWEYYPDDQPLRTFALQGDSRAALTPFLAHRHFGDTYKWLLYGDDDTFFLNHALMHTLQDLDPNMPYFLTDHLWWSEYLDGHPDKVKPGSIRHPHAMAPRCVPCHYTKNTSGLPFPSPVGCPCTPELLCMADPEQEFLVVSGPRGACAMPRAPIRTYSMHGGAGAVLSIGLLRAIDFEWFEDCVHNTYSSGGDAFISICLWEAGYAMTDIDPLWHPKNSSMFDVGKVAQMDHENIRGRFAVVLQNHLQKAAGVCTKDICQLEWDHTLSLHLRSRMFPSHIAHEELVRVLTGLADIVKGHANPFDPQSKNSTQKLVNQKVMIGLQAIRELSKIKILPRPVHKGGKPMSVVMEEANAAATEAVAHAILNAIWDAKAPELPASPKPVDSPPEPGIANVTFSRVLPSTL